LKKALAIFLFACFAIYHFGYYALYFSFDYHLENQWADHIYSENQGDLEERLLEIPLSAPYMINQDEFQPTNTRFEKDGKYFRAIKQRYQNDTLQLVYVADTAREVLDNTVKKWISSLTEDEIPQDQNGKSIAKTFIKDYIQPEVYSLEKPVALAIEDKIGFIFSTYMSPFFQLVSPPPQEA
jgi:hypothetical protein